MRDCKRNTQKIYYALYKGKERTTDADGNKTSQFKLLYHDPVSVNVSVSTARGTADIDLFGVDVRYSRVISTVKQLPIDEQSIIWIDKSPDDGEANYRVVRVANGLNQNFYAIEEKTSATG